MKKIIALVVLLAFTGCFGKKDKKSVDKYPLDIPVRVVGYEILEKKPDIAQREFAGQIITNILSELSFRVGGTIQNRFVDLGDYVHKGQVLADLDPTDYQLQYNQSYAQMERSRANFVNAQSTFKRDGILYLENSISLSQYQSAQASYEASKSELSASISSMEYQKKQLGYTKLYAPADGTISQVNKQEGEAVTSSTAVFTLNVNGDLEILFNVSENAVPQIKMGESIPFTVDALGKNSYKAIITNIGTASTGFGNTYPIKAKIMDPAQNMRVGMTVTATLELSSRYGGDDRITIPPETVMVDPSNKKYVFIIEGIDGNHGIAQKAYIQLGNAEAEGVEVLDGLSEGEYLVTDGYNQIVPGEKVELKGNGEQP